MFTKFDILAGFKLNHVLELHFYFQKNLQGTINTYVSFFRSSMSSSNRPSIPFLDARGMLQFKSIRVEHSSALTSSQTSIIASAVQKSIPTPVISVRPSLPSSYQPSLRRLDGNAPLANAYQYFRDPGQTAFDPYKSASLQRETFIQGNESWSRGNRIHIKPKSSSVIGIEEEDKLLSSSSLLSNNQLQHGSIIRQYSPSLHCSGAQRNEFLPSKPVLNSPFKFDQPTIAFRPKTYAYGYGSPEACRDAQSSKILCLESESCLSKKPVVSKYQTSNKLQSTRARHEFASLYSTVQERTMIPRGYSEQGSVLRFPRGFIQDPSSHTVLKR